MCWAHDLFRIPVLAITSQGLTAWESETVAGKASCVHDAFTWLKDNVLYM